MLTCTPCTPFLKVGVQGGFREVGTGTGDPRDLSPRLVFFFCRRALAASRELPTCHVQARACENATPQPRPALPSL